MRLWILSFFIFPLTVLCHGQGYLDSLPKLNKGEILMLGETHFRQEVQNLEIEIIKKYASETHDPLVVYIELPYQFNFYVRNLIDYGDSLSLKTYFKLFSPVKTRTYAYNLIMSLYKIRLEEPSLQFFCIDRNGKENSVLYTIRDLLKFYPNCPESIQKMRYQTDSLIQTDKPDYKSENNGFALHFKIFKQHFHKHKKDYRRTLSASDYAFLTHLMGNFTESFDIRESIMYRNICRHYQQECKHIAINGSTHTNKEKLLYYRYSPKTKSLAWQLNNDRTSPFRKKLYSILISQNKLVNAEVILNDSVILPSKETTDLCLYVPNFIRKELMAQKKDVAIKMIDPLEYPDIHRQFDGFIMIHKAHSTIPGNKETIEKNW